MKQQSKKRTAKTAVTRQPRRSNIFDHAADLMQAEALELLKASRKGSKADGLNARYRALMKAAKQIRFADDLSARVESAAKVTGLDYEDIVRASLVKGLNEVETTGRFIVRKAPKRVEVEMDANVVDFIEDLARKNGLTVEQLISRTFPLSRLDVDVSEDAYTWLKARSEARGMSISGVIRELIFSKGGAAK